MLKMEKTLRFLFFETQRHRGTEKIVGKTATNLAVNCMKVNQFCRVHGIILFFIFLCASVSLRFKIRKLCLTTNLRIKADNLYVIESYKINPLYLCS